MKKCRTCGAMFAPFNSMQKVCSGSCALSLVREEKVKEIRKDLKVRKQKLKSKSVWAKETQSVFNKYIRLRDAEQPCISCGRKHEGQYHAGHYKTVGAHPELRFHPLNCHKQCAPCNNHLSGNITNYRVKLLEKIGEEKLEWLEGNHPPAKYSIDDLKEIKKDYQKKIKEIE